MLKSIYNCWIFVLLKFFLWITVPFVFRDLTSWINSMMTLVSSDELAKDVTGAEALLERHQVGFVCMCVKSKLLLFWLLVLKNLAVKSCKYEILSLFFPLLYMRLILFNIQKIKFYYKAVIFPLFFIHLHFIGIGFFFIRC